MLEGRDWINLGGASQTEIAKLRDAVPIALPESYLAFLAYSNGGEGALLVQPFLLSLYPIEYVIKMEQKGTFKEFFPGLFVIGSDGGGDAFAFDLRGGEPYPVVWFDMTNCALEESIHPIASCFEDMLNLIGIPAG